MISSVLIVDDSIGARTLLGEMLPKADYEVHLASSGKHALTYIEKHKPDLILLDINMSEMDGLEVCKRLKADKKTQDIPIILISGTADASQWAKGFELGAADCILKPIQKQELQARVQTQIILSRSKKQLRQRENELEERNRFIESLTELNQGIVYIYDIVDRKIIYSNDGIRKVLGYSIEEIQAMGDQLIPTLMHPDDFQAYIKNVFPRYAELSDNQKNTHEYRIKRKGDIWRWMESSEAIYKRQPDGTPNQIFGVVNDITEKKMGEDALKSLATSFATLSGKEFFRAVSKHIATISNIDCVFVGELDSLKEKITILGGYNRGEWLDMSYALVDTPCEKVIEKSFCFHPDSVQTLFPKDEDLVSMQAKSYMGSPLLNKQNEPIGLMVAIHSREMNSPEVITSLFNIFIDRVTAEMLRGKAEEALLESEERYRSMVKILPDGILIHTNGKIVYANDSAIKLLDATDSNELIGCSPIEFVHPDYKEISINRIQKGIEDNKIREPFEYILITLNGIHKYVISAGIPFAYKGEISVLVVLTNITELKQSKLELERHKNRLEELVMERTLDLEETIQRLKDTQSQLVQSEKLASLGILTAGIAHEINNPINYINSSIVALNGLAIDLIDVLEVYETVTPENINEKLEEIKRLKEQINLSEAIEGVTILSNNIKTGAKKTADIVKSLRNFSRTDSEILTLSDINESIDSTLILLNNQYKDRIEIIKNYERLPLVKCYAGKLNQVFMNVLANAIQSIDGNGTITIKTKHLSSAPPFLNLESILISINDTGAGIPLENKNKVFEPFFTTKEIGKGTGLGLSISYGIIEQHKGKMEFTSEVGKGTEFKIYLPV